MTSRNGAERSGDERGFAEPSRQDPAVGPVDPSLKGSTEAAGEGEDTTVGPALPASADWLRACRRKAGVEYRPV